MNLRVFWRLLLYDLQVTLEYRGEVLVWMFNLVVGPVIALLVWLTANQQGIELPYNRQQFVTYYVLLAIITMLTSTWLGEFLAEEIRLGGLSHRLIRPVPMIAYLLANNLGEKLIKLPYLLPMVGVIALFFRDDLRMPEDWQDWLLFAICLPMAAGVAFLLDMVLGSLAFWIDDVRALVRMKDLAGAFLAGQFVPLALFPPSLSGFLEVQPFRYTLSFPLEVLTGALSPEQLQRGFLLQISYLLLLWLLYSVVWRVGLRKFSAVGA
jgi:ABC-2 type transport system permease protein